MKPLDTHTNSPAADKVAVGISAAFVLFHKALDLSVVCLACSVFWRIDGLSYDVRLSLACEEETVLSVHLKGIGFIHPLHLI